MKVKLDAADQTVFAHFFVVELQRKTVQVETKIYLELTVMGDVPKRNAVVRKKQNSK